ncbi:unnamed protein product [Blepharisma stoltei]|uniref:PPM-type phosphatase domain-containing protein n=1 Tax=Blepharisma stoltei TaxID=1481888 RepID=A0AAU9JY54_9CILI|nr:unnamed protein product [Blepharisma stoltei]
MGSCVAKSKRIKPAEISDSNASRNNKLRLTMEFSQKQVEQLTDANDSKIPTKRKVRKRKYTLQNVEQGDHGTLLLIRQRSMFLGQYSTEIQKGFEERGMKIEGEIQTTCLQSAGIWVNCRKGMKPDLPNQDDYCILIDGPSYLLSVYDGHGQYGHDISNFVHSRLPNLMIAHPDWAENPKQAIKDTFVSCQQQLIDVCDKPETEFNCILSGTTATIVFYQKNKLIVANVGDSRAVLAKLENGKIIAHPITRDHKPEEADEKHRIERAGGEVKKLKNDWAERVYFKGKDSPGLSMTRALGDTMLQSIGISSEPETYEIDVEEEDQFVLICSDGVWEFISNQEAVEYVYKFKGDVRQATEMLSALAWSRWIKKDSSTVDDITVILAYLPKNFENNY